VPESLAVLLRDLEDEQAALDALVAPLPGTAWEAPTPAEGWAVRDQIAHLAFFDETATLAIVDAERFAAEVTAAFADFPAYEGGYLARARALAPAALLARWRAARRGLLDAAGRLAAGVPVPWYGLSMRPAAFVTARLMETWSHGQDVADGLGVARQSTDRVRHVAFLGVRTRGHSFAIRGRSAPEAPVFVGLALPSGAGWMDGDPAAADRVTGPAVDFGLVVTQRRHVADTDLVIEGPVATEWMRIAQAFAGPPGSGRRPGQFPRR